MVRIGFDMDGVIAESNELLCQFINEYLDMNVVPNDFIEYGIEKCLGLSQEQVQTIVDEFCTVEQTCKLKPISGAIEFLQDWYELGHEIHVITNRKNEEPLYLFFEKYLPEICINIHHANPKTWLIKELGITHFIDDCPAVILSLANAGICPIIYSHLYNLNLGRRLEKLVLRVFSWDDMRRNFIEGK
jgi:hypothetical protein